MPDRLDRRPSPVEEPDSIAGAIASGQSALIADLAGTGDCGSRREAVSLGIDLAF
jgi:hypothetical protein